jgi:nitrogen fixation NifU-like protein
VTDVLSETERAAVIEQLAKSRHGFGLADAGVSAHRRSPSCGDEFTVQLLVADDVITELHWEGHGCVVSTAAASALAELAPGLSSAAFAALAARYFEAVQAEGLPEASFGDAEVFAGIGRYPLRAGCASLSWRAALDALDADVRVSQA